MKAFTLLAPFLALTLFVSPTFATFLPEPTYEVPVNEEDYRPNQETWDRGEIRMKQMKCEGRMMAIMYKSFLGYSQGSTLKGVCRWENSFSIEACTADESNEAILCFNKAVDRYDLADKHGYALGRGAWQITTDKYAPAPVLHLNGGSRPVLRPPVTIENLDQPAAAGAQ